MVRNMTTLVEQIPTYLPCPTMFFNMDDPRKKSNLLHHPFSSFKNAKLTVHIVLTNSHDGHRWLATIRTSFILANNEPKKFLGTLIIQSKLSLDNMYLYLLFVSEKYQLQTQVSWHYQNAVYILRKHELQGSWILVI